MSSGEETGRGKRLVNPTGKNVFAKNLKKKNNNNKNQSMDNKVKQCKNKNKTNALSLYFTNASNVILMVFNRTRVYVCVICEIFLAASCCGVMRSKWFHLVLQAPKGMQFTMQ